MLYALHYQMYYAYCTLYTICCKILPIHFTYFTLHTVYMDSVQCTVYSVHMYSVHCTVYSVLCTYVECTLYSVH